MGLNFDHRREMFANWRTGSREFRDLRILSDRTLIVLMIGKRLNAPVLELDYNL